MSPAVKQALAYLHITGRMPAHVRYQTLADCRRHTELVEYEFLGLTLHRDQVKPDALAAISGHCFMVADRALKAQGWQVEQRSNGRRMTSHYISYVHPDIEGYAASYRGGGYSISRVIRAEGSGAFIRNESPRYG